MSLSGFRPTVKRKKSVVLSEAPGQKQGGAPLLGVARGFEERRRRRWKKKRRRATKEQQPTRTRTRHAAAAVCWHARWEPLALGTGPVKVKRGWRTASDLAEVRGLKSSGGRWALTRLCIASGCFRTEMHLPGLHTPLHQPSLISLGSVLKSIGQCQRAAILIGRQWRGQVQWPHAR